MAYKDKDRQKQANREAAQRRRDKIKGMTEMVEAAGAASAIEYEPVKYGTLPTKEQVSTADGSLSRDKVAFVTVAGRECAYVGWLA